MITSCVVRSDVELQSLCSKVCQIASRCLSLPDEFSRAAKCDEGHVAPRLHFPICSLREMRGCLSGVCIIKPAQGADGQQQQEGFAK